ncbi:MAG: hypothetical protein AAB513_02300 [Patescibacteria group bacterium]
MAAYRKSISWFKREFLFPRNMCEKTKATMPFFSAGFTLVEALIAISILLVAVVEPLSLTSRSVFNANVGKDQITASYLAQEGMEFIRNKRDVNILKLNPSSTGPNWLVGLEKCMTNEVANIDPSEVCTFDALNDPDNTNSYIICPDADSCQPFSLITISGSANNSLKRYGFGGFSPITLFERSVTITEIVPGREAEVSVKVSWRTVYLDRSFTLRERLFNWGY